MHIRIAITADWPAIWSFFHPIVAAGETFTYPMDLEEKVAHEWWMLPEPDRTVVAVDGDGAVLGTAKMNRNHMGNAAHIAGASYVVEPAAEGRGVGRALCEYTLEWARMAGFGAMQFNAVVQTNTRAVGLYESLGFEVLGTLPDGFAHPVHGHVGLHLASSPRLKPGDSDPTWRPGGATRLAAVAGSCFTDRPTAKSPQAGTACPAARVHLVVADEK